MNGVTSLVSGALPATLNVSANPAGLETGTYTGTISATDADGGTQSVTVTLVITSVSNIANPASMVFVAQVAGAAPASQVIQVTNAPNASYTASVSAAWLSISSAQGPTPAQITVTANPLGLAPGTYLGDVQVTLATHVQVVRVTLIVSPNPVLATNTGEFIFSYFGGNAAPVPFTLNVTTTSGSPQTFTFAPGVPSWLKITGAGASQVTPGTLTVALLPQALPTGTYLADVILTPSAAGGIPAIVPVLLMVTNAPPIAPNVTSLSFNAAAGGASQTQTIQVTASTATAYTASATTAAGGDWLSVSPVSGVANAGNTPVTVTADATNLAEGTYQGTITFTTAGGVVSQVSVTITVVAGNGPLTITPASLAFAYTPGGLLPGGETLQIAGQQNFTASAGTSTGGTWLSVTPASGSGTRH